MHIHFDRAGRPIGSEEWQRLFDDLEYRFLAEDMIGDVRVVTIWTGMMAPSLDPKAPPRFFETMVFGHEDEGEYRYATEAEALTGHAATVRRVRESRS